MASRLALPLGSVNGALAMEYADCSTRIRFDGLTTSGQI